MDTFLPFNLDFLLIKRLSYKLKSYSITAINADACSGNIFG